MTAIQCCCFIQFILVKLETFMVLKVLKRNLKWKALSKKEKYKYVTELQICFFLWSQHQSASLNITYTNSDNQKWQYATLSFCLRILVQCLLIFLLFENYWLLRSRHSVSMNWVVWPGYFDVLRISTDSFFTQEPIVWNWTETCIQQLYLLWNRGKENHRKHASVSPFSMGSLIKYLNSIYTKKEPFISATAHVPDGHGLHEYLDVTFISVRFTHILKRNSLQHCNLLNIFWWFSP